MVGRRLFPFGMAYFQGRTVSFREGRDSIIQSFLRWRGDAVGKAKHEQEIGSRPRTEKPRMTFGLFSCSSMCLSQKENMFWGMMIGIEGVGINVFLCSFFFFFFWGGLLGKIHGVRRQ